GTVSQRQLPAPTRLSPPGMVNASFLTLTLWLLPLTRIELPSVSWSATSAPPSYTPSVATTRYVPTKCLTPITTPVTPKSWKKTYRKRSEERRVGKERRSQWAEYKSRK